MIMKVLIADKLPEQYVSRIAEIAEVIDEPKLTAESLAEKINDADILIVRSTEVTGEAISNSKNLSLIIRAGAGVNNINMKAANKKGIYVANCPGKNSIAVAELAMGLILAIDRRIPDNIIDFNKGVWNKGAFSKAEGLYGKKLGVVGAGQIGIELIKRASAFGLDIIAWSRSLTDEKAALLNIRKAGSLEEIFSEADIVSIHLAQNADTKKIISKELIGKMKEGAYLINTARAGVIDEAALIEALKSKKIFAGLDVFNEEPEGKDGSFESKFIGVPNVYITHHIGASTEQAQNAVAEEAYLIVKHFIEHGIVNNWVNHAKYSEAKYQLIVRHFDKPGVLARILNLLKEEHINAQEMENVIFEDSFTACCTIKLEKKPSEKIVKEIQSKREEVINASLVEL
jgi:D-3-phosphoglycerate dehydrogenase / 2-oxoglutarate reductase